MKFKGIQGRDACPQASVRQDSFGGRLGTGVPTWCTLQIKLCYLTVCFLSIFSSELSASTDFEEAAKAEGQRQLKMEDSPESLEEASALESLSGQLTTPTLHLDQSTPKRQEKSEEKSPEESLADREQRNWLLTGVLKLNGEYDETLSDEERQLKQERKRGFYSPTLFVDHMAELKGRQRADSAEDTDGFSDVDPLGSALDLFANQDEAERVSTMNRGTVFDRDWLLYGEEGVEQRELSERRGFSQYSELILAEQRAANQTDYLFEGMQTEAGVVKNPYIVEPVKIRFNEPKVSLKSEPKVSTAANGLLPSMIVTPESKTPPPEVKVFKPKKDIDEKYFKNLDRF